MINETESAGVEVTQADREARARWIGGTPRHSINAQQCQALDEEFARHRTTAEAGKRELVEALRALEDANNELCRKRSTATYEAMLADGCTDQLIVLDEARRLARATLAKHGDGA